MNRITFVSFFLFCFVLSAKAQHTTQNAHSHNDYQHESPFYEAYLHKFGSVEADIFAIEGKLFVAHIRSEVKPERTIDSLYIHPIVTSFRENRGKAWKDSPFTYQLLIDIKTEIEPALSILTEKLKLYPDVFNPSVNKNAIRIVITGNRPEPSGFRNYPRFIFFDGKLNTKYNRNQLKRVALFSANMKQFTQWNGETTIPVKEEEHLKQVIDSVHGLNKKIRFWNAPDTISSWKTLMEMNVDYINTDEISELSGFLLSK